MVEVDMAERENGGTVRRKTARNGTAQSVYGQQGSTLELRIPTEAELRLAYREDLEASFPPDELKPLSGILRSWRAGEYEPWCLYDGGSGPIGECFLWLGTPGWALLDYLCVSPGWRNDGFGSWMLEAMGRLGAWKGILGECEAPEYAPDRAVAERRLDFYRRSGARLAGYDTELFGVRYRTLYWAERPVPDRTLIAEHQAIYRLSEMPPRFRGLFRIPCPDGEAPTMTEQEKERILRKAKADAEAEEKSKANAEAEEKSKTEADTNMDADADTDAEANTEAGTDAETETEKDTAEGAPYEDTGL